MLELYNARQMWKWGMALAGLLDMCSRGFIVGDPDTQTAWIHRLFSEACGVQ